MSECGGKLGRCSRGLHAFANQWLLSARVTKCHKLMVVRQRALDFGFKPPHSLKKDGHII